MSKEIKDYLHLYLGCEVDYSGTRCELFGVHQAYCVIGDFGNIGMVKIPTEDFIRLKPILRPLSDMTEDELNECGNLDYDFSDEPELNKWDYKSFDTLISANQFVWLLSKHFDIFNLIPEGLAIDKNKI